MEQQIAKRINSYFDLLSTNRKIDKRSLAIRVIYSPAHYLKYQLEVNEKTEMAITLAAVLNINALEALALRVQNKSKEAAENEVQGWLIKGIRDEAKSRGIQSHQVGLLIMNKEELKYFVLIDGKINGEINLPELINKYSTTK